MQENFKLEVFEQMLSDDIKKQNIQAILESYSLEDLREVFKSATFFQIMRNLGEATDKKLTKLSANLEQLADEKSRNKRVKQK